MMKLATLFVLLGIAVGASSAGRCNKGNDEQLPIFERVHKNMNLTLNCYAVEHALTAADWIMSGEKDHINRDYWCMYSKYTWSFAAHLPTWLKDVPLREMPFDQIAQTALLHRGTQYGCGARLFQGAFQIFYAIACIYMKLAPENLCNIEWSVD
ncbi:hypothetical protein Q1695_002936 [Nippostrongylus brasiliensis]|nr:hypothetical protein Q1695_002936 [Nippostrongylus brasiliensis]